MCSLYIHAHNKTSLHQNGVTTGKKALKKLFTPVSPNAAATVLATGRVLFVQVGPTKMLSKDTYPGILKEASLKEVQGKPRLRKK